MNEYGDKSRSHGIPKEVLEVQADCINVPIEFMASTWADYEEKYIKKLKGLKSDYGVSYAVFGDIDIESHREWEEKVSSVAELHPQLPLWRVNRVELVEEMIEVGVKALIVSCQTQYADSILGKIIDYDLLNSFRKLDIDACGENGEYHTLVIDGPLHRKPLSINVGKKKSHGHYSFLDISMKL